MRIRSMLRLRLSHWISALGLLLVYSSTASMISEMKPLVFDQFFSTAEQTTSTEPSFTKISLPISQPIDKSQSSDANQPELLSSPGSDQQESEAIPVTANQNLPMDETLPVKSNQGEQVSALPMVIEPEIPLVLVIPAIDLIARIIPVDSFIETIGGKDYLQWMVPDQFAAGWQKDSALLGVPGNTVLNGHHNEFGEVFGKLVDLEVGDEIIVFGDQGQHRYVITNKMIFSEKYEQIDVRINNAEWILPSQDERLTLITCWPYTTNTHRLIIVARPEISPWLIHYMQ